MLDVLSAARRARRRKKQGRMDERQEVGKYMKTPKRLVAVTVIATLLAPLTIYAFTSFITL